MTTTKNIETISVKNIFYYFLTSSFYMWFYLCFFVGTANTFFGTLSFIELFYFDNDSLYRIFMGSQRVIISVCVILSMCARFSKRVRKTWLSTKNIWFYLISSFLIFNASIIMTCNNLLISTAK